MMDVDTLETSSARESAVFTRVIDAFAEQYGGAPTWVVRAPGRVNLIGDHTDYNDGFVLPMAIDRAVWIALRPRDDDQVNAFSLDFGTPATFALSALAAPVPGAPDHSAGGWMEYVRGVAWAMQDAGFALRGWEGVVAGDVPLGAGLSSSAALELAAAQAFTVASKLSWDATAMALIGQRAENVWVGVQCGVMDQLISAAGVTGHALRIDCRSLQTHPVPVPDHVAVVVLDTATRRGLVDSEYNARRAQCRTAATSFGVTALRDVDQAMFDERAAMLHPVVRRRARHVITENARVLAASDALAQGDIATAGRLMNESHASLRDDFEVSSAELDIMVSIAQGHPACYGARMTGAGFGGCAVAIVDATKVADFAATVAQTYAEQTQLKPSITRCVPSAGASQYVP